MLAGKVLAAGRGGVLDLQRRRAQVVLDAETDQAEDGNRKQGGGQGGDGAAASEAGLRNWLGDRDGLRRPGKRDGRSGAGARDGGRPSTMPADLCAEAGISLLPSRSRF